MKVPNVISGISRLVQLARGIQRGGPNDLVPTIAYTTPIVATSLILFVGALASACGGGGAMASPEVESDPDVLARALVEASYEREYEFLWEHASVDLKRYYGNDDGNFLLQTTRIMDEFVPEGSTDLSETQVDYSELAGVYGYDLSAEAPDGSLQNFTVFLVKENEETWAYCNIQASFQDEGFWDTIGESGMDGDSTCF